MAKFDRSAYKATSTKDLSSQDKEIEAKVGKKGNNNNTLSIDTKGGKNRLRIFPKHPKEKSFMYPRMVHFLPIEVDDSENAGKKKIIKKPIFNSRIHGDTEKDIVDEYIKKVYEKANSEIQDGDEKKKFLRLITGWGSGPDFKGGIKAQQKWMCYGNLTVNGETKFGRVELATSVKDKLNAIAQGQDDTDGMIVVDPFTDIDDGRAAIISFDKNEKDLGKKYTVSIDLRKPTPLTDEEFEMLEELKPLGEIYTNCYKAKDFELAMEGLKRFDEESAKQLESWGFSGGYDIFEDDDFLDLCEEIAEYYPEEPENPEDKDPFDGASAENPEPTPFEEDKDEDLKEDPSTEEGSLEDMSLSELKQYIKDNDLQIRVLRSYTKEQVLQYIQEEEEIISEESAPKEDVEETPEPEAPRRRQRRRG